MAKAQAQDRENLKQEIDDNQKNNDEISATPIAKKIAEKDNIDLSKIKGSGPKGKITKNDLENIENPNNVSDVPDSYKSEVSSGPEAVSYTHLTLPTKA